jgi:HSP20 family protein
MWTEALSLLEQADRLHRQFLRASGAEQVHAWEPPVDVIETGDEVRVQIALPGVSADSISVAIEPGGVTVSALRAFACREDGAYLHRVEIPYGRFERRLQLPLDDPYTPLELARKSLAEGVLTLIFRKKEGR